jgi:Fe2+ transport system protein B
VVDASNLERNLFLTTQIIDMDIRTVIALNMYDELVRKGDQFDYDALGIMLGIPIIPTISSRGKGLHDLLQRCIKVYEDLDRTVRHIHINYGDEIETSIRAIQEKINIPDNCDLTDSVSSRFLALKLLERMTAFRGESATASMPRQSNILQKMKSPGWSCSMPKTLNQSSPMPNTVLSAAACVKHLFRGSNRICRFQTGLTMY